MGRVSGVGPGVKYLAGAQLIKRDLARQQLVLLLHARKCQCRELLPNHVKCTLPYCILMKGVLNHLMSCQADKSCKVTHCSSSRQIINHWNQCKSTTCKVCYPLKQAHKNCTNKPNAGDNTPEAELTVSDEMRLAFEALGISCPSTSAVEQPALAADMPVPDDTQLPVPDVQEQQELGTDALQQPGGEATPTSGSDAKE